MENHEKPTMNGTKYKRRENNYNVYDYYFNRNNIVILFLNEVLCTFVDLFVL